MSLGENIKVPMDGIRWQDALKEAEEKAEAKEEKDAEIPEEDKGKETMEVEIQDLLQGMAAD